MAQFKSVLKSTLRIAVLAALGLAAFAAAETFVWVDEAGVTHITDDPKQVPDHQQGTLVEEGAELAELWGGEVRGPAPPQMNGDSSREDARIVRLLNGAVDDLRRGETARATVALEDVLRLEPGRAEPHWYLALLDRQRGRFDSAEAHLRAFLGAAGEDLETWRLSAERRLTALEDERRLVAPRDPHTPMGLVSVSSSHFRIHYDDELGNGNSDYAETVIRYLEEARATLQAQWGAVPEETTGVVLYGKAAYLRAHRHRFSFETVGFFDGRIHVVSAAHPAGELRSLLFHEYTHALFRERTGTDRPFWLNEGFAEIVERSSRGEQLLSRADRFTLLERVRGGDWLPLSRLAPSFAGLRGADARVAYLEATAATDWIMQRTDTVARNRLLEDLARGKGIDHALERAVGLDQAGVDAAVRKAILAEFPGV